MITAKDIRDKYDRIYQIKDSHEREKLLLATLGDVIMWLEEIESAVIVLLRRA